MHLTATVLLVENEPALLDLLREMLEQAGYRVLLADSGESAIRVCYGYGGKIDVLLCDVLMGQSDGFEVAANVKSVHPRALVLLMSGSPVELFPNTGIADEFLEKPFAHHELLAAISRYRTQSGQGEPYDC